MNFYLSVLTCLCGLLFMTGCHEKPVIVPESPVVEEIPMDTTTVMEDILARGTLRAATDRRYLNYRILEGRPAGFQFELLDDFCEQYHLKLDLMVNDSLEECYQMLADGTVDLYAGGIDTILFDSLFHHVILETPVDLDQTLAWVFKDHENDSSLYVAVEEWLDGFQGAEMRNSFYHYFRGRKMRSDSAFRSTKYISRYDDLIRAEGKKMGWDWRLLAAIIYQESRFKPDLESDRGAYGLMQLMPTTMERYGIDCDASLEAHLEAGGKLLLFLDKALPESIADTLERQKFVLAAYNAGLGNVLENRKKAERNGKDPDLWTGHVETFSPRQTYRFVKDVTKRYEHYKALIQ